MKKHEVYKLIENHYRENVFSLVKRLRSSTGSIHNAEDVVQESYARACTYWDSYNESLSFDAWISGIRNNCFRDLQKDNLLKGMVKDDLTAISDPPHHDATDGVLIREVRDKISKQSKKIGYILKLYLLDEYTGKEVSELTGMTPEAVRKIVSRFRQEELQVAEGTNV